jgi:hypothetical protein
MAVTSAHFRVAFLSSIPVISPSGWRDEELGAISGCLPYRKKFSHTGVISAAKSHPTCIDLGGIVVENTGKWLVLIEVASHVQLCKM